MKGVASFLLLAMVCALGMPQNQADVSESLTWRYSFVFTAIDFRRIVRITPQSEERTCINVPILNPNATFCLDNGYRDLPINNTNGTITISSDQEVQVHGIVVNNAGKLTGSFLVLPIDYLGTRYVIPDYYRSDGKAAQVAITAIFNDTEVEVMCDHFKGNRSSPIMLHANQSTILPLSMLDRGVQDVNRTEISSSSDKPISVVISSKGVIIPYNEISLDHGFIIEQLLPVSRWGQLHFMPPFQATQSGSLIRVLALEPDTNITWRCGNASEMPGDASEQSHEFQISGSELCVVAASKPVQVMQYMMSSTTQEDGDASMLAVLPVKEYHGKLTFAVHEMQYQVTQYADIIIVKQGIELLRWNSTSLSNRTWHCTAAIDGNPAGQPSTEYCYLHLQLETGVYHVNHRNQSQRFWIRLYAHNKTVGAAMLGGVVLKSQAPFNVTTATTTSNIEEELTDLFDRLNDQVPGDFENFNQAEEVMTEFNSYLGEKDELESINEMDMAFSVFTGVLSRQPLKTATADDAKSFINLSSSSINVIFSQGTTQLMENACSQGTELGSSPEQVQRRLEEVMREASSIIVEGGVSSFESDNPNAALDITSTGLTSMSSSSLSMSGSSTMMPMTAASASDSVCESTGLEYNGVTIPCEVLKQLRAEAAYRVYLPHAGQAVALSNCSNDASKRVVATPLVGIGLVSNLPLQNFSKNISISLTAGSTVQNVTYENAECNFWDYATSSWSTSGCFVGEINGKEVTCLCNHLTSFAVLLKVSSEETPPKDEKILEILTWIGCIFSILSCFLTCAGYAILRLRSDLILIHGNLALALGLAQLTFLFIDLVKPESTASCTAVATLVYYLFLVMFAWMSIEGIHLYLLTFVVWNAEKRKIKYYLACAWGIPIVFVIVLLSVHANDFTKLFGDVCFLTIENYSLLFFAIPIAVVIVFNVFVMSRVVYQIAKMADGPTLQTDSKTRAKHGVKALVILLPIMGLTWVFGFLTIEAASLAFQYLFVIFNSLQGVFIFLIHFVRNSEVCHAIRRRREKWMVSHSSKREYDYRVKTNTKKSSSTGGGEKTSETFKTPDHTMTLTNLHTDPGL